MSWIYLIVAGLFEVAFTSCMGKVKKQQAVKCTGGSPVS
jgi:multidrug transporter EmrE-like cation transporter